MSLAKFWSKHALVRLFALHAAVGFGLSALLVGAVLYFDAGGLGALMLRTPWTIALLWFFAGLTFASVQMGAAIMALGEGADEPD